MKIFNAVVAVLGLVVGVLGLWRASEAHAELERLRLSTRAAMQEQERATADAVEDRLRGLEGGTTGARGPRDVPASRDRMRALEGADSELRSRVAGLENGRQEADRKLSYEITRLERRIEILESRR